MKEVTLNKIIGKTGLFVDGDWVESKDQDINGDVRLIQLADIGDGFFINKSNRFLTSKKAKELKCTYLKQGDLLIARMPDPLGRACIFPGLAMPCVTVVDVCIVRPDASIADSYWLKYLINSYDFRNKINKYITGTTRQRISRGNLEKLSFNLPEIPDQIKIAAVLSKTEAAIQERKESIYLIDEFLKSTFLKMFGDPVKNQKNWETKTIESLVKKEKYSIKRGPFGGALKKEIFVSSGYLVYEQYHALNNDFTFERYYIDEKTFQELKAFEVFPSDIIISCSGIYLGKLAIVPSNAKKGIINQALLKISLDTTIMSNQFFVFLFSHESFKREFFGNSRGSGIPNFPPMEEFKKFRFIYPPSELQNEFKQILTKSEILKQQYKNSLQELEHLHGSLSQKAFKGELDLSKLETTIEDYEPQAITNIEPHEFTQYDPAFSLKDEWRNLAGSKLNKVYLFFNGLEKFGLERLPFTLIGRKTNLKGYNEYWKSIPEDFLNEIPLRILFELFLVPVHRNEYQSLPFRIENITMGEENFSNYFGEVFKLNKEYKKSETGYFVVDSANVFRKEPTIRLRFLTRNELLKSLFILEDKHSIDKIIIVHKTSAGSKTIDEHKSEYKSYYSYLIDDEKDSARYKMLVNAGVPSNIHFCDYNKEQEKAFINQVRNKNAFAWKIIWTHFAPSLLEKIIGHDNPPNFKHIAPLGKDLIGIVNKSIKQAIRTYNKIPSSSEFIKYVNIEGKFQTEPDFGKWVLLNGILSGEEYNLKKLMNLTNQEILDHIVPAVIFANSYTGSKLQLLATYGRSLDLLNNESIQLIEAKYIRYLRSKELVTEMRMPSNIINDRLGHIEKTLWHLGVKAYLLGYLKEHKGRLLTYIRQIASTEEKTEAPPAKLKKSILSQIFSGEVSGVFFKEEYTMELIKHFKMKVFSFQNFIQRLIELKIKYSYEVVRKGIFDALDEKTGFLELVFESEGQTHEPPFPGQLGSGDITDLPKIIKLKYKGQI